MSVSSSRYFASVTKGSLPGDVDFLEVGEDKLLEVGPKKSPHHHPLDPPFNPLCVRGYSCRLLCSLVWNQDG